VFVELPRVSSGFDKGLIKNGNCPPCVTAQEMKEK
jgi:hypothetical protein